MTITAQKLITSTGIDYPFKINKDVIRCRTHHKVKDVMLPILVTRNPCKGMNNELAVPEQSGQIYNSGPPLS